MPRSLLPPLRKVNKSKLSILVMSAKHKLSLSAVYGMGHLADVDHRSVPCSAQNDEVLSMHTYNMHAGEHVGQ